MSEEEVYYKARQKKAGQILEDSAFLTFSVDARDAISNGLKEWDEEAKDREEEQEAESIRNMVNGIFARAEQGLYRRLDALVDKSTEGVRFQHKGGKSFCISFNVFNGRNETIDVNVVEGSSWKEALEKAEELAEVD